MYSLNSEIQSAVNNIKNVRSILMLIKIFPSYVKQTIRLKNITRIIKQKNYQIEDSLIISSESRSGSTWLMEMLIKSSVFVPNWEPLHPILGVIPKEYKFGYRPYINMSIKNHEIEKMFKEIFELKRINFWSSSFIDISKINKSKIVLTKTVRGNLLLPWLTKNYAFKYKPILLLRHPISTVISQKNSFNINRKRKEVFQIPDCINNDRYINNETFINSLNTELESRIALWCINNILTIENKYHNINWIVLFYENLLTSPRNELKKLSNSLGISFSLDKLEADKPSASSNKEFNKETKLKEWTELLTEKEKDRVQKIFDYFNFTLYNAYSPYPNISSS